MALKRDLSETVGPVGYCPLCEQEHLRCNKSNGFHIQTHQHTRTLARKSRFVTHQIQQMHRQQGPRRQDRLLGKVQTHLGYSRRKQRERKT